MLIGCHMSSQRKWTQVTLKARAKYRESRDHSERTLSSLGSRELLAERIHKDREQHIGSLLTMAMSAAVIASDPNTGGNELALALPAQIHPGPPLFPASLLGFDKGIYPVSPWICPHPQAAGASPPHSVPPAQCSCEALGTSHPPWPQRWLDNSPLTLQRLTHPCSGAQRTDPHVVCVAPAWLSAARAQGIWASTSGLQLSPLPPQELRGLPGAAGGGVLATQER